AAPIASTVFGPEASRARWEGLPLADCSTSRIRRARRGTRRSKLGTSDRPWSSPAERMREEERRMNQTTIPGSSFGLPPSSFPPWLKFRDEAGRRLRHEVTRQVDRLPSVSANRLDDLQQISTIARPR